MFVSLCYTFVKRIKIILCDNLIVKERKKLISNLNIGLVLLIVIKGDRREKKRLRKGNLRKKGEREKVMGKGDRKRERKRKI